MPLDERGAGTRSASEVPPVVEFVHVDKRFDAAAPVLSDFSLSIADGEFVTLLGPSGAGKTTVLMLLAGFERPSAGNILLDGRSMLDVAPHRRNLGVVFQDLILFPQLSVLGNVAYPLRMRGMDRDQAEERAREALEWVRLGGAGSRAPNDLSGADRQRAALARALVFEPDVVLLDEPFGGLDRPDRERLLLDIRALHDQSDTTILFVTHEQLEALEVSDRIVVLDGGSVQQCDTPQKLYEEPANTFVAEYIGDNNTLYGTVSSRSDLEAEITLDSGEILVVPSSRCPTVGDRAIVALRPERIVVGPLPETLPNRFRATVLEVNFRGAHQRLRLRLPGGADVVVKRMTDGADAPLRAATQIEVGWKRDDSWVLEPPP